MSKPEIKITSRKQNLNKNEINKTPINSNFLITLNLNQQYHKDEHIQNIDNDMDVFDEYINEMLNHIEEYIKLPEGVEYNDDNIKDVSADYTIEIGSQKKQIHTHIMLKFKHHTKIQLDYHKMKEFFCNKMQLKNVYMQSKLLKASSSDNIIDYLNKMV
jgi:hypothetical protein